MPKLTTPVTVTVTIETATETFTKRIHPTREISLSGKPSLQDARPVVAKFLDQVEGMIDEGGVVSWADVEKRDAELTGGSK